VLTLTPELGSAFCCPMPAALIVINSDAYEHVVQPLPQLNQNSWVSTARGLRVLAELEQRGKNSPRMMADVMAFLERLGARVVHPCAKVDAKLMATATWRYFTKRPWSITR